MAEAKRSDRPVLECRHFSGYKPCGKNDTCSPACRSADLVKTRVLIVHLGALGAVVRSTALLPAIHRKYEAAHITWITDRPADQLLREHPLVDRVLTTESEGLLALEALAFDVTLVIDKSLKAMGIAGRVSAREFYGFRSDVRTGAIVPATAAAEELWQIGLSDHAKFHVNQKTEARLVHEALELGPYRRDPCSLFLSMSESEIRVRRAQLWSDHGEMTVIGFNTGCASTIPDKKLSIGGHVELMREIEAKTEGLATQFVLLGGKEDSERNRLIAAGARLAGIEVIESPTELGLRDGIVSVAACDVVVTGDSLGMHMAIALGKRVVAWFGPTVAREIDFFERGSAVLTKAACSPCWKRSCQKPVMCYDQVDWNEMATEVRRWTADVRGIRFQLAQARAQLENFAEL